MARKPVFTESQVIDAVAQLNEKGKKINGTNLRLEVGSGSPQKLLETYNKLLAKGAVKDMSHSEVEALESQLEASLETLARVEDELDMVKVQANILLKMFLELSGYIPDQGYYLGSGILPFRDMTEIFVESIKEHEVNLMDDEGLFALRKWLLKREREEAVELSQRSGSSELSELKLALAKERYDRQLRGFDTEISEKEVEIESKIKKMEYEIRKSSPSLMEMISSINKSNKQDND